MPSKLRHETAQHISIALRKDARRVNGDPSAPDTWKEVCEIYGIAVDTYNAAHARRSYYSRLGGPFNACCIFINEWYPPEAVSRAFIHELAHHRLHVWIPVLLGSGGDYYCYCEDPYEVRHDIARRVERLVLG